MLKYFHKKFGKTDVIFGIGILGFLQKYSNIIGNKLVLTFLTFLVKKKKNCRTQIYHFNLFIYY